MFYDEGLMFNTYYTNTFNHLTAINLLNERKFNWETLIGHEYLSYCGSNLYVCKTHQMNIWK